MAASRVPAHQLSNGLFVSGRPDQPVKEKPPTMAFVAVPYTGGDVKDSGELGKMFDIGSSASPSSSSKLSRPNSGPTRIGSNNSGKRPFGSGPVSCPGSGSGSGSVVLTPTGLITSGSMSGDQQQRTKRSGLLKSASGVGVTRLSAEVEFKVRVSKVVTWIVVLGLVVGLFGGGFVMVVMKNAVVLEAVIGVVAVVVVVVVWNSVLGRSGVVGFVEGYADAELRSAGEGEFVKVTGVVTCGSISLETSFQRVSRCIYTSSELYEYKGWNGKSANPKHRAFSWGSRYSEKHVADFYISDFQSGLRALVKADHGAKVAVFVETSTVVDISKGNKDLSRGLLQWLSDHNLSGDDRIMRLKEGYIKEGSTVSVMGIVRRQDNVLMIVQPTEPISTGCQWRRCLFPRTIEHLILKCDDNQVDVIPV